MQRIFIALSDSAHIGARRNSKVHYQLPIGMNDLLGKSNRRRTFLPQSTEAGKERQASARASEWLGVSRLQPPERAVKAAMFEQIAVGTSLDDFPVMEH